MPNTSEGRHDSVFAGLQDPAFKADEIRAEAGKAHFPVFCRTRPRPSNRAGSLLSLAKGSVKETTPLRAAAAGLRPHSARGRLASGQRLIVEGKMVQRSAQPIYWTHWPTLWPRVPAADAPGQEEDAAATSFNVSVGIVGGHRGVDDHRPLSRMVVAVFVGTVRMVRNDHRRIKEVRRPCGTAGTASCGAFVV